MSVCFCWPVAQVWLTWVLTIKYSRRSGGELQASEAELRASQAEAELDELREAAASSGSTIEQWQSAYADLQQQQATAEAELQQLREAAGSSGSSSIEEWQNAYADLQQHYSSLQVGVWLVLLACVVCF